MQDDKRPSGLTAPIAESFGTAARPIVTVDVLKYQSLIDDPSLPQAQKEEFLQALWSIVVAFVDLGFGVHPLQEVCGLNQEDAGKSPRDGFEDIESEHTGDNNSSNPSPYAGLEVT